MAKILKKILNSLNPLTPCKKYGLSAWECPQFLFLLMGVIIMGVIIATYFIATLKIGDPFMVSLIVLVVGGILIVIDYIITNSFERIAEASRMKTEFISVVSHQLRSPLTNLKYSLEILTSGKIGKIEEKEKEYFEILKENIQRMGDLINDLLTISRIETGKLPLKTQEVSLVDLTKKLILKFKDYAEAANVKIEFEAERNLPKVSADPLWLEQVVENLVDNAIRYIKDEGEVKIKIYKDSKKIYFEIQDTGVGIPKEEQKYIFQKFFRAQNVLKYQTEGSGLGLHITKRILELMGGKIWFKSKEGKGTTFYFSLPIKEK
jgi:signal transduction histidine kinase